MKKYIVILISLFFSTYSFSEEAMCWVKYDFEKKPNNVPGGSGQSFKTSKSPFRYNLCKEMCYGSIPDYEGIKGIKSCTLDGINIESSPYKIEYEKNKEKICHVQVVGKYSFNLYLANSEAECKDYMANFFWCKKGEKCIYTLGQW